MGSLTALITLLGLLVTFVQEQGSKRNLSHRQFKDWLDTRRHDQLSDQLAENQHLQSQVDALLLENHDTLLAKIGEIERLLSTLLSRVSGFAGLARAVHPQWELSEQAVEILRLFVESGSPWMTIAGSDIEPEYGFQPKEGTEVPFYKASEPIFFEADLESLCGLGLLSVDTNVNGYFKLTRAGARYIRELATQDDAPT